MCWKIAFFSTQNIEKNQTMKPQSNPQTNLATVGKAKHCTRLTISDKKKNWQDFQVRWIIQIIFQ